MSIVYEKENQIFHLQAKDTSYVMGVIWCAPRQVDSEKNISFSASWFYQLAVFLCCL